MGKLFAITAVLSLAIAALSGAAIGAPSFLSTSGNILTPDDVVLDVGSFSANFHAIDVEDTDRTLTIIGANVGVTPSLELGIARFDPDSGDEETIISGKYRVLAETPARPSVVVGAVDVTGELDPDDDPGFYVVVGKNLTPTFTNVAGRPTRPLKGYIGIGTGVLDGLFAAIDWTISDRARIIAEFINESELVGNNDSVFNVGVRFALTNELRGDLALIDADDLGFGISYTKIGF